MNLPAVELDLRETIALIIVAAWLIPAFAVTLMVGLYGR